MISQGLLAHWHSLEVEETVKMQLKAMEKRIKWKMPSKTTISSFRITLTTPATPFNGYLSLMSKFSRLFDCLLTEK